MGDRKYDELRLLYSTAIEDIRYSKQQQWKIIHLTLLAIAAVGSVHHFTNVFPAWFLVASVGFVGLIGSLILIIFTCSLERYRAKKRIILGSFTDEASSLELLISKKWIEKIDWVLFFSGLIGVIGLAAYIAIEIILCDP